MITIKITRRWFENHISSTDKVDAAMIRQCDGLYYIVGENTNYRNKHRIKKQQDRLTQLKNEYDRQSCLKGARYNIPAIIIFNDVLSKRAKLTLAVLWSFAKFNKKLPTLGGGYIWTSKLKKEILGTAHGNIDEPLDQLNRLGIIRLYKENIIDDSGISYQIVKYIICIERFDRLGPCLEPMKKRVSTNTPARLEEHPPRLEEHKKEVSSLSSKAQGLSVQSSKTRISSQRSNQAGAKALREQAKNEIDWVDLDKWMKVHGI